MSCIPHSGGCERFATDALVAYINDTEGTQYEHRACLDQLDTTRPQPECLYVNISDDGRMVIERKSIMWPEAYAYGHSKQHDLATTIHSGLAALDVDAVYVLEMPPLRSGSMNELTGIGQQVAALIRANIASITLGTKLRITSGGHRFILRLQQPEERDYSNPERGFFMVWQTDDWLDQPSPTEAELRPQIEKIYAACIRKFAEYSDARRVLMLDPHGAICWKPARWWNGLLTNCTPPSEVDEVWTGSIGDDGFGGEEWLIAKVFGGQVDLETTG